jgi:chromosome segregation ATPase
MVSKSACYVLGVLPRAWVAYAFRRLPPVIRRDTKIAELQHELAVSKQQILRAREALSSERRQARQLRDEVRDLHATNDALRADQGKLRAELAERAKELSTVVSRQVQPSHRIALAGI